MSTTTSVSKIYGKELIPKLIIILFTLFIPNCAAPGSMIAISKLKGMTQKPTLQGKTIIARIDERYGLTGLDASFGKPEDYGHRDIIQKIIINKNGIFETDEMVTSHTGIFWIIPPLGFYPHSPTEPYFYLEFSNSKDEIYILFKTDESFDYEIYKKNDRKLIPKNKSKVKIIKGFYTKYLEQENHVGWILNIEIE